MQILPMNDSKSGLKTRRIPLGSEFSTGDNTAAVLLLLEWMFDMYTSSNTYYHWIPFTALFAWST